MANVLGSKRTRSLEERIEMTQDLRVVAITSCEDFFSQGEPQERAYRESLSEALGVLGCIGD